VIPVTDRLSIGEDEIVVRHARASGPGGQHVKPVYPISPS